MVPYVGNVPAPAISGGKEPGGFGWENAGFLGHEALNNPIPDREIGTGIQGLCRWIHLGGNVATPGGGARNSGSSMAK